MTLKHGFKQMLAEANAAIETVAVKDAIAVFGEVGYTFIDIREGVERDQGIIPVSAHVPRGFLEFHDDPGSPAHNPVFSNGDRFIVFCASGGALRTRGQDAG